MVKIDICKCGNKLEVVQFDWLKMPVKFCNKCKHYEFAYQKNLQKNIGFLSGYNWECWT